MKNWNNDMVEIDTKAFTDFLLEQDVHFDLTDFNDVMYTILTACIEGIDKEPDDPIVFQESISKAIFGLCLIIRSREEAMNYVFEKYPETHIAYIKKAKEIWENIGKKF